MSNPDSERKSEQTAGDRLREEINRVSKEIADHEKEVTQAAQHFVDLQLPISERPTGQHANLGRMYDGMVYARERLGIAQLKLTSLILQRLKLSSDQLDSDVRSLGSDVKTLNSQVKSLNESSRRIEVFNIVLIGVTIVAISITEAVYNPNVAIGFDVLALILLVFLIGRKRSYDSP